MHLCLFSFVHIINVKLCLSNVIREHIVFTTFLLTHFVCQFSQKLIDTYSIYIYETSEEQSLDGIDVSLAIRIFIMQMVGQTWIFKLGFVLGTL